MGPRRDLPNLRQPGRTSGDGARHVVARGLARRSGSGLSACQSPAIASGAMDFLRDDEQARVLEQERGAMLVAGEPGTGKSAVLRERFARLIESGADPERVALVVRTRRAKGEARAHLFDRLRASLPGMKVFTVYGL